MCQATECVIVALYAPPTAPPGTDTWITGFHAAELSPSTFVAATTACAALARTVAGVGVKVAEPVVEVKPLIRYWTSWTGMVSAAVPIPVVKSVAEVVAVHPATPARASVTWTMPRLALAVVPGAAEPRLALPGAVIESTPRT